MERDELPSPSLWCAKSRATSGARLPPVSSIRCSASWLMGVCGDVGWRSGKEELAGVKVFGGDSVLAEKVGEVGGGGEAAEVVGLRAI